MEFRKIWSWMFIFILVMSLVSTGRVAAEQGISIVILVSNNEADSVVAESLANLLNVSVVVTPWGIYNPNITAEIVERMPDKVIIIGGPVAVPVEYEQDLNNLGISYERWYGANRYSTNIKVIEKAEEEFPGIFRDVDVFVVNGRDVGAIQAVKKAGGRVVPIFVDYGLENQTEVIGHLITPGRVVIVRSPLLSLNLMLNIQEIVERNGIHVSEEQVEAGRNLSWSTIAGTEALLKLAKTTLDDLKVPGARNMLELATRELEKAKTEYARGNYEAAYRYSIYARTHANVVILLAGKERNRILHGLPKVALEHDILRLEVQVNALSRSGIDVSDVQNLLAQAKAALQAGDLDSALEILRAVKEKLRALFINEKGKIRHEPVGHGRGRRP